MATHRLLEAFRASKPALGAWVTLPGIFNARVAATASPHISWLIIDCEHGMTSLQPGAAESIVAISALGKDAPSTMVRIPATGPSADGGVGWQIKYVLDAGAQGVLVPMVSTASQARSVVAAARFPPKGIRGFGSPFTQTAWGISVADYLTQANDGIVVMTQVETVDAVKNLDEILSVDGLDGVFIGPYDLSLAHGYPPPSPDPHPDVEVIIRDILRRSHAKGKKCAIYCTSGPQSAKRVQEGFDMINVTSDSGAMAQALAQSFAEAVGEQAATDKFRY